MRYTQKVLGLLGEQDPLQVMQRTVPALRAGRAAEGQAALPAGRTVRTPGGPELDRSIGV